MKKKPRWNMLNKWAETAQKITGSRRLRKFDDESSVGAEAELGTKINFEDAFGAPAHDPNSEKGNPRFRNFSDLLKNLVK